MPLVLSTLLYLLCLSSSAFASDYGDFDAILSTLSKSQGHSIDTVTVRLEEEAPAFSRSTMSWQGQEYSVLDALVLRPSYHHLRGQSFPGELLLLMESKTGERLFFSSFFKPCTDSKVHCIEANAIDELPLNQLIGDYAQFYYSESNTVSFLVKSAPISMMLNGIQERSVADSLQLSAKSEWRLL